MRRASRTAGAISDAFERRIPAFDLRLLVGLLQIPQLDQAGRLVADRLVQVGIFIGVSP